MTKLLATAAAIVALSGLFAPPSFSANARHPYQNVHHANDRGNNTGNDGTARLNDEQLASIKSGRMGSAVQESAQAGPR